MRDTDLYFSFVVVSLFGLGISVVLASNKMNLKEFPSPSDFFEEFMKD